MSTSIASKNANKKQKVGDNAEVAIVVLDAQANADAVIPFSPEQVVSGLPGNLPLSLSSPSPMPSIDMQKVFDNFDAKRVGEI